MVVFYRVTLVLRVREVIMDHLVEEALKDRMVTTPLDQKVKEKSQMASERST